MKKTVYVDWESHDILNFDPAEKEFQNFIEEYLNHPDTVLDEDGMTYADRFEEELDNRYNKMDVWNFSDEEKDFIEKDIRRTIIQYEKEGFESRYEEIEIEIEL